MISLRDYQLAMLSPMCDRAPAQAQALLESVGADRSDTVAAEQRRRTMQPYITVDECAAVWGSPASDELDEDGTLRYTRWDLSFWPDLQVEFAELTSNYRRVVSRQFVRRPGSSAPQLNTLADLTPWSCTQGELEAGRFGPLIYVTGFGAVGDLDAFTVVDPETGRERYYWADFDWTLLQSVEPAPHDWRPEPGCACHDPTP